MPWVQSGGLVGIKVAEQRHLVLVQLAQQVRKLVPDPGAQLADRYAPTNVDVLLLRQLSGLHRHLRDARCTPIVAKQAFLAAAAIVAQRQERLAVGDPDVARLCEDLWLPAESATAHAMEPSEDLH